MRSDGRLGRGPVPFLERKAGGAATVGRRPSVRGDAFDCDAASKTRLPEGTTLRLEQSPVAKADKRADSPGWGMLGASPDGALGAVLSNLVTGNHVGTFHYRVTLRDRSQKILVSSNTFTVVWR